MKNKDPAVLFYPSDFIAGTTLMSYTERGMYITLLCLQRLKGHLKASEMEQICDFNEAVMEKFEIDDKGLYYNPRMDEEIQKRKDFTESRRKNGLKKWEKEKASALHMHMHMGNGNKNINQNNNIQSNNIVSVDSNTESIFPFPNNNNSAGACEENTPLSYRVVRGKDYSAYLLMNDEQERDLRRRLSPAELDHYLLKMLELQTNGYKFGCSDYEQILKMVDEDRKTR